MQDEDSGGLVKVQQPHSKPPSIHSTTSSRWYRMVLQKMKHNGLKIITKRCWGPKSGTIHEIIGMGWLFEFRLNGKEGSTGNETKQKKTECCCACIISPRQVKVLASNRTDDVLIEVLSVFQLAFWFIWELRDHLCNLFTGIFFS